jgi:hypothetical protein
MHWMSFCMWLQGTRVGTYMREDLYIFPIVEALHILCGNVPLVVSTSSLSGRLLGWGLTDVPVSKVAKMTLPWAWFGFTLQFITGTLLFSSAAAQYAATRTFYIKMLMIAVAGLNALIFQQTVYRRVATWDTARVPPFAARFAGMFSILLWFSVLVMGRVLNSAVALISESRLFFVPFFGR